ncbi:MAG: 1,2-diacylglycerol 3-beta-glucosyltransferase [Thermotogota bacterium]|nr:1,2-diacylglycerol 3-beta-glucosyltransferase [Thermotogota bacterium]MDK2864525.1 1,2-diacylglycerol 3-beta-glucosyltransferase [Thermotogota bacterium]
MSLLPAIALLLAIIAIGRLREVIEREKIELNKVSPRKVSLDKLRIVFTVKNAGEYFRRNLEYYLGIGLNIAVFDDFSNDGTWEHLKELAKRYGDKLSILRLPRDDRVIHPKAFAIEYAVKYYSEPYLLILDADTMVDKKTILKAMTLFERYDVISLTRRNPDKRIAIKIADTEELTNSCLIATGISKNMFFGSGFFFKRKLFESLTFPDGIFSEDSEFGFQSIKAGARRIQLLTLEAKEEAPKSIMRLFKQRFKWLFAGSNFNFTRYPVSSLIATTLFSFIALGTFMGNPVSLSLLGSFGLWVILLSFAAQRARRISFFSAFVRSLVFVTFYISMMVWVYSFVVVAHPVLLKRFRFAPTVH